MSTFAEVRHVPHAGTKNPVVLILDASETVRDEVATMFRYAAEGFAEAAGRADVAERAVVSVVLINRDRARALPLGEGGRPFVPVAELELPEAPYGEGVTPLHDAVDVALRLIQDEHARLRAAGTHRGLATLIMATDGRPTGPDGEPTDAWQGAATRLRDAREAQEVVPVALGFGGADAEILRAFAPEVALSGNLPDLADVIQVATIPIDRNTGGEPVSNPVEEREQQILRDIQTQLGFS